MASEFHSHLVSIHDEDLLRRMWEQSEDFGLKKEIRTHMYKLREERLRNFYSSGIMDSSGFGPTKTPLTPSHGESLADHSFQSLKAKEIRDSESPSRDFRISRTGIATPDTSGWNIVTSSEVSPDGRARKMESTATTEGVQHLQGGHSEFAGKNKYMNQIQHEGDEQNYTKRSDESSATQYQERTVVGDENSGRVETKSSSTTSSSHATTSRFSSTKNNSPYAIPDDSNISREFDDHVDSARSVLKPHPSMPRQNDYPEHHQRIQNERYTTDDSTNIVFLTTPKENEYVNKKDPQNIQKEVDLLAAQPGVIISRSVDYPDPNTKVITETKQLPDGTTVTTRKYETKSASSKTFRTTSNQHQDFSSRTTVEDRSQKNQVEYVKDREMDRIKQQQQQLLQNQTNKTIRQVESNDEVQTTRRSSVQNVDYTDKSVRKESLKKQVENVFEDNDTHSSVKKDLSQRYRNQEFIDFERGNRSEENPIHTTDSTNNTRINRNVITHATKTVIEDIQETLPAAGKPSYNTQKPTSSRPTSKTPERLPSRDSRDSRTPPYSGSPRQQPNDFEMPMDVPGYRTGNVPDKTRPRSNDEQPSSYMNVPQSTPAAGKPSYNNQPIAGKPSFTKSVQETLQTQHSKVAREIQVERIERNDEREIDYPREGFKSPPKSYNAPKDRYLGSEERDIPITRSYEPHDRALYSPVNPVQDKTSPRRYEKEMETTTTTQSQQPRYRDPKHPADNSLYDTPKNRPSEPDGHQPYDMPREPTNNKRSHVNDRVPNVKEQETTTTTTITSTYYPKNREPMESTGQPLQTSQPSQKPNERYIPITRPSHPAESEPISSPENFKYPTQPTLAAGKPSYTAPQHSEPYRAPSQDPSPKRPSARQPNEREDYPAGKPSYTAPRTDGNTPRQPTYREPSHDDQKTSYPRDIYPHETHYEPRGPSYRSSPRDLERPQYERRPSEESRVSTDTMRTNSTYITKKISVEVDAAHDAFARSLRCVSPSERGSVKSLRTSSTSVRSSPFSEKRSPRDRKPQRSPSRDSMTYSESSKISTNTVTKGKSNIPKDTQRSPKKPTEATIPKDKSPREHLPKLNDQPTKRTGPKDVNRPTTTEISPKKPSGAVVSNDQPDKPRPKKQPDIGRSNETINLTTTRRDSEHHVTTVVKQIEEYPAPKSPSSSPERSVRPEQPNRSAPSQTPSKYSQTPGKKDVPVKPATGRPSPSKPSSSIKFTKTIQIDNAIHRQENPSNRQPKKQTDKPRSLPQGTDDEGFEPESPRSSSPTSSVSDLVYHKGVPEQPDGSILTTNRKKKTDQFIENEREVVQSSEKRGTIIRVDDSTFNRRNKKMRSPSPEPRVPQYSEETPKEYESEPNSAEDDFPSESPQKGSSNRQPIATNNIRSKPNKDCRPRQYSPSPEREKPSKDSLNGRHPYDVPKPGSFLQPSDTDESHEQIPDTARNQTSDAELIDLTDEEKPREPFYLIEPYETDEEKPKRTEEPKRNAHPQFTRSETYEERCRKILGMDRQKNTTELRNEPVSSRKTSTRGVSDFIATEKKIDEDNRSPEKLTSGKPDSVPKTVFKPQKLPKKPEEHKREPKQRNYPESPDEMSPDDTDTYQIEESTETVMRTYKQSRESSPERTLSTKQRKPEHSTRKSSPETSPNRSQTLSSRIQVGRSPNVSPTRQYKTKSPTRSPTRKPESVESDIAHRRKQVIPQTDDLYPSHGEKSDPKRPQLPAPNKNQKNTNSGLRPTNETARNPERVIEESSPRRKPAETSPSRKMPTSSPTRKNNISTENKPSPTKSLRDTSPIQKSKRSEPYPTDKYCESEEVVITTTKTVSQRPYETSPTRTSPRSRSPFDKSPTRQPLGFESSTKPTRKYSKEKSPIGQRPRDLPDSRQPGHSKTPHSQIPDDSPYTPGRSPTRSPSPRAKHMETVTIVSESTIKGASTTPKGKPKVTDLPSHVTTAKIHLSPPAERKPGSTAVKKSPKTPDSLLHETVKNTRDDVTTVKTPISSKTRRIPGQKTEEHLVTSKKQVISAYEKIHVHKSPEEQTEEESEPEEEESDVGTDTEEVTTVIEATSSVKTTPEKNPSKKFPFTDRKDSAPVYRTTRSDKDQMVRSTSENLIKTIMPRPVSQNDSPLGKDSPRRKSLDKKRPIKCMATKTITITDTDNIINSEDMENVIIDIQQAKSSREPSPNRIVPTPVRPGEDTGIPRYPDKVTEPEDGARRRTKVKDVPIFEEDTNDYVRCHITEMREQDETVQSRTSIQRRKVEEIDEIIRPVSEVVRERPGSPDYGEGKPHASETDDEYRLTVHDKVAKFISTAEEVKKPKTSAPFSREPRSNDEEPDDDCLLSVNEKVNKFLTTADKVSKPSKQPSSSMLQPQRPHLDNIDDELKNDESILSVSEKVTKFTTTIEKLVEDKPQRSPKLVASIERQVSRKDEEPEDIDQDDDYMEPNESTEKILRADMKLPTRSIKDRYQPDRLTPNKKEILPKPVLPKSTEVVKKAKSVFENKEATKPKQRDILSRPSVWDQKRNTSEVRLEDIGVHKPFDDETEEIIKRERSRSRSPGESEHEPVEHSNKREHQVSKVSSNSISSKKNIYESQITKKTVKNPIQKPGSIAPNLSKVDRQTNDLKRLDQPVQGVPRKYLQETDGKYQPKTRAPPRERDDGEFVEVVETTTTTRSERRSPSRRCEYYSPERDEYSPSRSKEPSPVRSHPAKLKKSSISEPKKKFTTTSSRRVELHSVDSSPKKPSHSPDDVTSPPMKATSRVAQTKLTVTRNQRDSSPTTTHPKGKLTSHVPSHRPSYMEPTVSSLEHRRDSSEIIKLTHQQPSDLHRAPSYEDLDNSAPTNSVPSYMEQTISSMEHRRDSVEMSKTHVKRTSHDSLYNESSPRSAKFGVELKRTDVHDSSVRRKSSSSDVPHIEEIFDLDVLEKLLETVVGYEQRRRIRAQIRIVRKMLEEGTLERNIATITTTKTTVRKSSDHSPVRKTEIHSVRRTETSPDGRAFSPKKTKDANSSTKQFIESESHHEKERLMQERSQSPQRKSKSTTTTTEVRRVVDKPVGKKSATQEEKPIWATKNILKKPSETDRMSIRRTTTTKTQRQIVTKDDADCITSSYGIGPTDEDGKPLFGIRALKKKPQQSSETKKITGSIVTESYYSENGAPPVGERKVTVYSNDPEQITDYEQLVDPKPKSKGITQERTSKNGITSLTRVQKIGQQKDIGSPELLAITDGKTATKQVKMVRKGSVKEMSEKFKQKGATTSITEKNTSTSYPKAGLILRTQTYSSTENEDPVDECNIEIHTTRKLSQSQMYTESDSETDQRRVTKATKTFLNSNGEKITGVEDVLDRMRNADNVTEDGDTPEDREARSLLNKFLGASVLMSGVESMVPKEVVTRTVVETPGKHEVRTTRVTKTITSGGSSSSPVARKTCEIEEIWDEEYLKQLLEQSTNYEERRRIRARIRQIMAEKQACTEIATNVKAEKKTEQQSKAEIKSKKVVIQTEANEESDTESEYEEVEVVEEVTDDSSAEGEEEDEEEAVEEEEEEEEEQEQKQEEEKEKEQKEGKKSDAKVEKSEESDVEGDKIDTLEDSSATKEKETVQLESAKETETQPINASVTSAENSKLDEDELKKEQEAKEQKACTTETTETKEKDGAVVTTTTKVTTRTIASAPKPVSPFAKFRQLDKQNSQNSPNSPSSPMTPGGTNRGAPLFQFTDPALCARAATVKEQLLQWCQMKTKEYENVQITNFSTCWSDGLAFCALIHHFLPDAFDYSKLTPKERRHNFELAFRVADEEAGIAPLLDVEDMVVMRKPDWKCVFTYVQSIFRRFRNCA